MNGDVLIAAPRPRVWAALNDPQVLARCIDGVETLTRVTGDDGERFEGKMNARVGPVRATFTGQVTLVDIVAPESYRLVGEGKGGVAGFAKGEAAVSLAETTPETTTLSYTVKSSVGGKLAQLGARLIEGTAKTYAETFFARLKAEVESADIPAAAPPIAANSPETAPAPAPEAPVMPHSKVEKGGISPLVWGGLLILAVLAFLLWQWR
ncbi:CoxG family protein [Sandarakinorhabdus glacialis]|nr:carbon monoxide dehydrogenase subunit G [Polymorphobacter glacialis]